MTKESTVFFLGIVLFVTPYIGIPEDWKLYIYTGLGVIFMIVGYILRQKAYIRSIQKENGERDTDSFMESNGSSKNNQENKTL